MDWSRWFRHLFSTRRDMHRAFPPQTLEAIESAISASERDHSGEIRFAIESSLDPPHVQRGRTARDRAFEVFAALGVWDTHENNGVLVYVLLADRRVEVIADRGFNGRVSAEEWAEVCRVMESRFRANEYEAGAVEGVKRLGALVARHFPARPGDRNPNELPNRPALL